MKKTRFFHMKSLFGCVYLPFHASFLIEIGGFEPPLSDSKSEVMNQLHYTSILYGRFFFVLFTAPLRDLTFSIHRCILHRSVFDR